MRNKIIAALALVIITATASTTVQHMIDSRSADSAAVTNYNDGFTDGVCTGSVRTAHDAYGIDCR